MSRLALLSIFLALPLSGCATFKDAAEAVDRICVRGRLSEEQAATINALEWNKTTGDPALEDDRVVARGCSEALRDLEGRD